MQRDNDERNYLQADNKDSNNTPKPFEPRRNTEEIKLKEGMGKWPEGVEYSEVVYRQYLYSDPPRSELPQARVVNFS